jgi:hypothetical protein
MTDRSSPGALLIERPDMTDRSLPGVTQYESVTEMIVDFSHLANTCPKHSQRES